jgi:hypothetical protein
MTDVRLTATTPTGDVVYVLANAKGELRLEEPIVFDGNLDEPLTCTSLDSSSFAGSLCIGGISEIDLNEKLHVKGNVLVDSVDYAPNQDQPYLIAGTDNYTGDTTNWGTYGFQHRIKSNSGGTGRVTIDSHSDEVFCATTANRVGIGTTNPLAKLDVNGQVYAWSNTETVRFKSSRTGTSEILTVWGGAADINSGTNVFSVDGSGDVTLGSRGKQWLIRESNGVAMLIEQTRLGKLDEHLSNQDEVEVRDLPSEIDACLKALNEVMQRLRMTPPAGWPVWDGSDINSEI